jgi:hypothetical protein
MIGKYQPLDMQVLSCFSKVTPVCEAGQYVENANSSTSDAKCTSCPFGMSAQSLVCAPQSVHSALPPLLCPHQCGVYIVQAPTSPAPPVLLLVAHLRPTPALRVNMSPTSTHWWLTTAAHCAHKVCSVQTLSYMRSITLFAGTYQSQQRTVSVCQGRI